MSLLDANVKRVLADLQKLPLGEISKVVIREVVAAGAEKSSKKEEAEKTEKKEAAPEKAAPEKKEEPAAKKEPVAEKKDK